MTKQLDCNCEGFHTDATSCSDADLRTQIETTPCAAQRRHLWKILNYRLDNRR